MLFYFDRNQQLSIAQGLISASQPNLAMASTKTINNNTLRSASSSQIITQPGLSTEVNESRNDLSFEDELGKDEDMIVAGNMHLIDFSAYFPTYSLSFP